MVGWNTWWARNAPAQHWRPGLGFRLTLEVVGFGFRLLHAWSVGIHTNTHTHTHSHTHTHTLTSTHTHTHSHTHTQTHAHTDTHTHTHPTVGVSHRLPLRLPLGCTGIGRCARIRARIGSTQRTRAAAWIRRTDRLYARSALDCALFSFADTLQQAL